MLIPMLMLEGLPGCLFATVSCSMPDSLIRLMMDDIASLKSKIVKIEQIIDRDEAKKAEKEDRES